MRLIAAIAGGAVILALVAVAIWAVNGSRAPASGFQRLLEPHRNIPFLRWLPTPIDIFKFFSWARS